MALAGKALPTLRVVGALWRRDGQVFLAQRPEGKHHGGLWELPGGKQELGETAKAALAREVEEELGVQVQVGPEWATVCERREDLRLSMRVFQVDSEEQPAPLDHQAIGWFDIDQLKNLPMPPMDDALRQRLIEEMSNPVGDLWDQTFAFVRGISTRIETALWTSGVLDHRCFIEHFNEQERQDSVIARDQVVRVRQALNLDAKMSEAERWSATPARHRWRLLERWASQSTALDFECDRTGAPTVMGVAQDEEQFTAYVDEEVVRWWLAGAAEQLPGRWTQTGPSSGLLDGLPVRLASFDQAPAELDLHGLILVFGGRKFDVAMLRKVFDAHPIPERYADLLDVSRQGKYRGGLKAVERSLGIRRATRIADLRGRDAISLWDRVSSGGDQAYWAFADLIAYNRADTVNLFLLRDRLLLAMSDRLGFPDWYRRIRRQTAAS